MNRLELIDTLKKAEPALSSKDVIPIFACFCFSEGALLTYDDAIAIQVPFASSIRGGVRGRVLLDWLSACGVADVSVVSCESGELRLRAGKASVTLPVLSEDEFIFSFPAEGQASRCPVTPDLLQALKRGTLSMGLDPSEAWRMGITLAAKADKVVLYSCDNFTVTRTTTAVKGAKLAEPVILPPRFVDLLTTLGLCGTLIFTPSWVEFRTDSGTRVFSKAVPGAQLKVYEGLFSHVTKDSGDWIPIPKNLGRALQRAIVLLGGSKDKVSSATLEPRLMRLLTESAYGNADDPMKLEGDPESTAFKLSPSHLERCLPYVTVFRVVEGPRMELMGEGFDYLLSLAPLDASR